MKYADIFLPELPEQLPPNQGLGDEHIIETTPDATPPSKSAYQQSPAE